MCVTHNHNDTDHLAKHSSVRLSNFGAHTISTSIGGIRSRKVFAKSQPWKCTACNHNPPVQWLLALQDPKRHRQPPNSARRVRRRTFLITLVDIINPQVDAKTTGTSGAGSKGFARNQ